MDALILVLAPSPSGPLALPRRIMLDLQAGKGELHVEADVDAAWRASVVHAWRAACALSGRFDADARLSVASRARLVGGSAGLPVGLLALHALLDIAPRDALFATGTVVDEDGSLDGGAAAHEKAAAASQACGRLEKRGLFLAPPAGQVASSQWIDAHTVADVGSAFALACPQGYAAIAEAHHRRCAVDGAMPKDCILVHADPKQHALPDTIDEIPVVMRETIGSGVTVDVVEKGMRIWRVSIAPPREWTAELVRLRALARRATRPSA